MGLWLWLPLAHLNVFTVEEYESNGRLLPTVFLCDYLLDDVFLLESLRVLNRREAVDALKRAVYTGGIASNQVHGDVGGC